MVEVSTPRPMDAADEVLAYDIFTNGAYLGVGKRENILPFVQYQLKIELVDGVTTLI